MPSRNGKPGMVNRQAVGTYKGKLHQRQSGKYGTGKTGKGQRHSAARPVEDGGIPAGKKDNIQCAGDVVKLSSLTPDPMNARLHPDRNLQAIMESLARYGQRSPLVVRKQGMVIAAGNGRLEAMKALGWTKCAVSVRPMTDAEFLGYALADNRTAELAKWDFEVVARLDALISEGGGGMPGWSKDELEVLRAADWTPPPITDDDYSQDGKGENRTEEEQGIIDRAVALIHKRKGEKGATEGRCLMLICQEWMEK